MAKRPDPPASHLKIMIWEAKIETYISRDMLQDKKAFGEQQDQCIVLNPDITSIPEMLDTFCHEVLHFVLGIDEEKATRCTRKVMQSLTAFERMRLFLKLAQSLKKVDN